MNFNTMRSYDKTLKMIIDESRANHSPAYNLMLMDLSYELMMDIRKRLIMKNIIYKEQMYFISQIWVTDRGLNYKVQDHANINTYVFLDYTEFIFV